jgi:hypothetical protein
VQDLFDARMSYHLEPPTCRSTDRASIDHHKTDFCQSPFQSKRVLFLRLRDRYV